MIVNATTAIEDLTLLIEQEIHVHASLEDTFRGAARAAWTGERGRRWPRHADGSRGMAGRPLVSRSRRRQRALLGARAGHQAAHADRIFRSAVHVVPGCEQRAVPAERRDRVER